MVNGKDNAGREIHEIAGDVGTLFQDPEHQFFALNVDDELAFAHECRGVDPSEISATVLKMVKRFSLEKVIYSRIFDLSEGEKQKVAICRSLICKPKIIFADEPTGSIDKDSAKIFFEMVEYLNREKGVSFVIVTHNEKFLQLATKAVYLNEGVITEIK